MNKIVLFLILICYSNCRSQTKQSVDGKWYLINKSGYSEFTITKDSIINKKVSIYFEEKYKSKMASKIYKKVYLNDRILLIGEKQKPDKYYTLATLVPSKNKNSLKYIWNGIDTIASIKTLININKNDNRKLLGYDLYNKEYLEVLKKKKSIETMTKENFEEYLSLFSKNIKYAMPIFVKNTKGYYGAASSFNFQICLQTLLELGYNPVQDSNTIDAMFLKFMK